jgi:hypothetical protein
MIRYKSFFPLGIAAILCGHGALASEAFVSQATFPHFGASAGNFPSTQMLSVPVANALAFAQKTLAQSNLGPIGQNVPVASNSAETVQIGANNSATILQTGAGNLAAVYQRGNNNTAIVTQSARAH